MTILLTILAALARFASTTAGRFVIGLVLLVGLVWGAHAYGRAAGRAEVRAEWDAANLRAAEDIKSSDAAHAAAAAQRDADMAAYLRGDADKARSTTNAVQQQIAATGGCRTDDAFPDGLPDGWHARPQSRPAADGQRVR